MLVKVPACWKQSSKVWVEGQFEMSLILSHAPIALQRWPWGQLELHDVWCRQKWWVELRQRIGVEKMLKMFLEYRRTQRSKAFCAVYTWTSSKYPTWHGFSYTGYHSDVPVGTRKTTTLSLPPAFHWLFWGIVVAKKPDIHTAFSCDSLEIPNKALRII